MNLYFTLPVLSGVDVAALCDELNALPFVELAEPAARALPPPVDLAPPTPSFSAGQHYRAPPPAGIGVLDPAVIPGGDGSGIAVVDVEYSWQLDHEDLELPPATVIGSATPLDPFGNTDHGTAVLGEISSRVNAYGTTGAAAGAVVFVAPANTAEFGYSPALAIMDAISILGAGNVILVEQQACVCGNTCDSACSGCGPVEWEQVNYDAIAQATSLGITVVEPAGNGNQQLDAPACLGRFDRNVRDSGAIIVGAGDPFHKRLAFSSHGSRVDLQAWGERVVTTGYGELFDPADVRQRYTGIFGGTSSASPTVTAAALAVQGARVANSEDPLDPLPLRALLTASATPQDACDPVAANIGGFPNIPAALALAACADGLDNDGDALVDVADPDCASGSEDPPPQCSDGVDNDADGRTDLVDGDCVTAADPSEWSLRAGDILLADMGPLDDRPGGASRPLRVDPVSGFQTALAGPRELSDASALRLLPNGRLLALDFTPARVFEIDPAQPQAELLGGCASQAWGFAVEAAGTIVFTDGEGHRIERFNPVSGAQTTVSSGGALILPRGVEVETGGTLVVADQGLGPAPPALRRINAGTGAQSLITSSGLLIEPRGLAIEDDGSLVVAGGGRVVRVHPVSGAQALVASGGSLVALGGIAVDDCTGDLFTAERGVSGGTPALVRVHPVTGAQSVVSSGNHFVEPLGVSFVTGDCVSLPLTGSAQGGSVAVVIDQVMVSVTTTQGQALEAILTALAQAIRNHPIIEGAGIAATTSGLALQIRGDTAQMYALSSDPGLELGPVPQAVPALSAWGLGTLGTLLIAGAVLAQRRRTGTRQSDS